MDLVDIIEGVIGTGFFGWVLSLFLKINKSKKYSKINIQNNIKNKKYIRDLFVYLQSINDKVEFFLLSKRDQKKLIIKKYILFTRSYTFNNDYKQYTVKNNIFENKRIIYVLWLIGFKRLFINILYTKVIIDINALSEFKTNVDYLGYSTQKKFESSLVSLRNEVNQLVDLTKNRYLLLHSDAGNGKTMLMNFWAERLLNKNKNVIFRDSIALGKSLDKLLELLKNISPVLIKQYVFIDGLNEITFNPDEIESFFMSLENCYNKRRKIIITTRSQHLEYVAIKDKYSIVDLKINYYNFLSKNTSVHILKDCLIDRYCKYYDIDRGNVKLQENYIFQQMLLVKIYFEVLKENNVDSISKARLYNDYINLVVNRAKMKITPSFQRVNLDNTINIIISELLKNNRVDYETVFNKLSSIGKDTLEFLVNEEVILRIDNNFMKGLTSSTESLIQFNFDDIRDYFIANRLINNSSNTEELVNNFLTLISNNEDYKESVYEHLIVASINNSSQMDRILQISVIRDSVKTNLLLKNEIYNDYLANALRTKSYFNIIEEVKDRFIYEMNNYHGMTELLKFLFGLLKDDTIINQMQLFSDRRNYFKYFEYTIEILDRIINNHELYNKRSIILFLNMLLDTSDLENKDDKLITSKFDQIVRIYGFTRRGE